MNLVGISKFADDVECLLTDQPGFALRESGGNYQGAWVAGYGQLTSSFDRLPRAALSSFGRALCGRYVLTGSGQRLYWGTESGAVVMSCANGSAERVRLASGEPLLQPVTSMRVSGEHVYAGTVDERGRMRAYEIRGVTANSLFPPDDQAPGEVDANYAVQTVRDLFDGRLFVAGGRGVRFVQNGQVISPWSFDEFAAETGCGNVYDAEVREAAGEVAVLATTGGLVLGTEARGWRRQLPELVDAYRLLAIKHGVLAIAGGFRRNRTNETVVTFAKLLDDELVRCDVVTKSLPFIVRDWRMVGTRLIAVGEWFNSPGEAFIPRMEIELADWKF